MLLSLVSHMPCCSGHVVSNPWLCRSEFQVKTFIYYFFCFVSCSNGNGSKMNGSLEHLDQPDPDTIKMFVGQIPRSWSETELKELFEPFGAVHQINILRDRTQNPPQSKGEVGASHYVSCCLPPLCHIGWRMLHCTVLKHSVLQCWGVQKPGPTVVLFAWRWVVKHNTQNSVIATSCTITFQHHPPRQHTALLACTRNGAASALQPRWFSGVLFRGLKKLTPFSSPHSPIEFIFTSLRRKRCSVAVFH